LSTTERVPVLVPFRVGVKATVIVQFAPAARPVPHVLASVKSPLTVIVVIVEASTPELLIDTVCVGAVVFNGSLGKVRVFGERLMTGSTPLPVRLTV
jgi:hypothetical protein